MLAMTCVLMKYLFKDWRKISSRIKHFKHIFLFFDYDGTLTPIVSVPHKATIPVSVRNSLKKIKKHSRVTLAIVSGRSLKDAKKKVGIKDIIYAGNHGLEIEGNDLGLPKRFKPGYFSPEIKKIETVLKKEFHGLKGIKIENKGATLSLHFRQARGVKEETIEKKFNIALSPYLKSDRIKTGRGKKVLEVRPGLLWDKGKAVSLILKKKGKGLVFYLGDDVTDMDAFRAIKGRGVSIFVGRRSAKTGADYYLKNPREVEKFIQKFLDTLGNL